LNDGRLGFRIAGDFAVHCCSGCCCRWGWGSISE